MMPTDPTCIEETFRGFDWPETVMYEYAQLDCEFGYRGTFNSRYCNFYETWDDEIDFGCFALSYTEDWDEWDNSSWIGTHGLDKNATDGTQFLNDGELQLSYALDNKGEAIGAPDSVRSFFRESLPARYFVNVHRSDDECNSFVIAWGKNHTQWAEESFRIHWDCYQGSFRLSNSSYLDYDGFCFLNDTKMELTISVYDTGYVSVETDSDCQDVSIWVNDMPTVNETHLWLTTDVTTSGETANGYDDYDEILARFGTVRFSRMCTFMIILAQKNTFDF